MTENLLRWGNFLTFQEAFNFQLSVSYKSVVFKYVADKSIAWKSVAYGKTYTFSA